MKSEFEKWLGDVWLSDAEWDESKNTYSDSRIHCMWSAWQHQQSKVDELQKRLDAVKELAQTLWEKSNDKHKQGKVWESKALGECADEILDELEQALKGGSDEIQNR